MADKAKSYSDFLTRPQSNEGVVVDLYAPDGKKTKHWIKVVGVDSDIYRDGKTSLNRLAMDLSRKPKEEAEQSYKDAILAFLSECIIGWSFEEEPTKEERLSLLQDAPQIRDRIEDVVTDRSLFVKKKSGS